MKQVCLIEVLEESIETNSKSNTVAILYCQNTLLNQYYNSHTLWIDEIPF